MSRTTQPAGHWVVCYDIAQPRRRRRVAACLEAHGIRLQRSVFDCEATSAQMHALHRRCRAMMAPDDRLLAYLVRHRGGSLIAGMPVPRLQDYWLC